MDIKDLMNRYSRGRSGDGRSKGGYRSKDRHR